jgi:hypothetical protein
MREAFIMRAWNADEFHRRVLEYEQRGYIPRRDTYRVIPEVNPETGEITHLHTIELVLPDADETSAIP